MTGRGHQRIFGLAAALAALMLAGCAGSSGPATAKRHMIASANPHASRAGLEMLRAGGSAVDAAIAAQIVLTLVEPQSSGIGGGAFMLAYDKQSGRIDAYDGRETAPKTARAGMFLGPGGKPQKFLDAVVGGRSVGVPGVLRMLEMAHRRHGKLPWAKLFAPAIRLAEAGFPVSPRLAEAIATAKRLKTYAATRTYFHTSDGAPLKPGHLLSNPALADTLRRIAAGGADAFYTGDIAGDIARAVRAPPRNPGGMAEADIASYRARRRAPLCRPYREWRVCTMPPPTSGGVTTLQILRMLEHFDLPNMAAVDAVHLISEASRLAYADREHWIGDPDFATVPVKALLARAYLRQRAGTLKQFHSVGKAAPGRPLRQKGNLTPPPAGDAPELPSTSHLSIVDRWGNAVSMTTSIENTFGSRLMVRGFLLNNQLTDFSFTPSVKGRAVANRVQPGKRPRSSMSPTLVFDRKGKLVMAVGSPGGSRIIAYVVKTLVAALDWGLDMQSAISLPNHTNRNGPTDLEKGTNLEDIADELVRRGHKVRLRNLVSGLHGIRVTRAGLEGGVDPRREGVALGD